MEDGVDPAPDCQLAGPAERPGSALARPGERPGPSGPDAIGEIMGTVSAGGDSAERAVLARRFRVQGAACAHLGSPLYAGIMEHAARDVEQCGILLDLLDGWESRPGPDAMALRLFGAVHRLVLSGRARELARFYPSAGGMEDAGADAVRAWPFFLETVRENGQYCRSGMEQAPQTNEPGRSAALAVGFVAAHQRTRLPLDVLEVGASAGLNLYWDSFCYGRLDGSVVGDPESPVRFPAGWYPDGLDTFLGPTRPGRPAGLPPVVQRRGCDRAPVDITNDEGALTLMSYVWPDQNERFARLKGAIEVARRCPVTVEKAHAPEWVAARLGERREGTCRVVVHSIFLQYMSDDERGEFHSLLEGAGSHAVASSPLAWLRMEPARERRVSPGLAEVRLTVWPRGEETVVAHSGFHGHPVLLPT